MMTTLDEAQKNPRKDISTGPSLFTISDSSLLAGVFVGAWISTMDTRLDSTNGERPAVAREIPIVRKYNSEAEARRGEATWWREESWPNACTRS
jgi:hypothetical protein